MRDVIEVGTARAEPGQRGDGVLRVAELNDGTPVDIPVAVVNGTQDGSVLWVQNGVHGMEYVGAGALHRVLRLTSPRLLRGVLIAVPMVNILAYRAGARSAPIDGLDMNRIYPGRPLHQVMHVFGHSEVVINKVFNEIRRVATHVIDLHAGGWYTTMSPYAQYLDGDGPYQEASAALARASGMTLVWRSSAAFMDEKAPSSLKIWAARASIPGVTLEVGGQGRLVPVEVRRMAQAVVNIMRHLQMVDGEPEIPVRQYVVRQGHWLRPKTGGLLFARVKPLQRVRAGQITHVITDLLGRPRERLRAPVDGLVVGVRTLGTVNSGEYCGNIGEVEGDGR